MAAHPTPDLAAARTCYDHLAGRLGVALFDALVDSGAIVVESASLPGRPGPPAVAPGPAAAEVFGRLGIELTAASRGRRRIAASCLDWTERRPHLAGALGAAICEALVERGWVRRREGTRAVELTAAGRHALRERLGGQLDRDDRAPLP